ncbi:endonuclease reverse, partial [Colletotrichum chrysophilum]
VSKAICKTVCTSDGLERPTRLRASAIRQPTSLRNEKAYDIYVFVRETLGPQVRDALKGIDHVQTGLALLPSSANGAKVPLDNREQIAALLQAPAVKQRNTRVRDYIANVPYTRHCLLTNIVLEITTEELLEEIQTMSKLKSEKAYFSKKDEIERLGTVTAWFKPEAARQLPRRLRLMGASIDILLTQEPSIRSEERRLTRSHPGFEIFIPVNNWVENRPRVITYLRRGIGLRGVQSRPLLSPSTDLLFLRLLSGEREVLSIVNVYNAPRGAMLPGQAVRDLVASWLPQARDRVLVAEDFNLSHWTWQPEAASPLDADDLVERADAASFVLLSPVGEATHKDGNTLDLWRLATFMGRPPA